MAPRLSDEVGQMRVQFASMQTTLAEVNKDIGSIKETLERLDARIDGTTGMEGRVRRIEDSMNALRFLSHPIVVSVGAAVVLAALGTGLKSWSELALLRADNAALQIQTISLVTKVDQLRQQQIYFHGRVRALPLDDE